jgi:hypothetical protein
MRRLKEYNPDQHYLISFDPQKAFPVGSYEYFIVDLVKKIVDEKKFYPEKEDKGGSEPHNPKAILGVNMDYALYGV